MKKLATKKLALGRETLAPLTAAALEHICGGNVTGTQTQRGCPTDNNDRTCGACIPDNK